MGLTLLILNALAPAFSVRLAASSSPTTITVPDDYQTVQAAVAAANPGDTVYVRAGTYVENLVIDKALSLVGESAEDTIINGGGVGNVVDVVADGVNLTGFTICNGSEAGISLDGASGCNIFGNNITANSSYGILFYSSSDNSVALNNVTNNADGINLDSSSNGNSINGNNITNNGYGVYIVSYSSGNSVAGNDISANGAEGVYIASYSSGNIIAGNNMSQNADGMNIASHSNGNSVSGNNITANSYYGVFAYSLSYNNSVVGNEITYNEEGVDFWTSYNDSAVKNNMKNMDCSLVLDSSSNDSIVSNDITAISGDGVRLSSSTGNIIIGNNITGNIGYGINLYSSSNNNTMYQNNFINNTSQVYSPDSTNVWDDGFPSGGNYWSDYNGTNSNGDGIGDTPYVIDANNTDLYPLMAPYSMFDAGTWNGTAYNVGVMSNSTFSGFQVDVAKKTIDFNVTSAEGSTDFCRVTIPNIIVQNLWQGNYTVLVDGKPWPFNNWTDTTNTYVYFNYTQSQHQIEITPELPSFLILPMLMIVTLLATITSRRKWSKHHAGSRQHPRTASNK
jgi:parallel beta-helix repeat protein